jgi:very-short-patch-repair endonuclease
MIACRKTRYKNLDLGWWRQYLIKWYKSPHGGRDMTDWNEQFNRSLAAWSYPDRPLTGSSFDAFLEELIADHAETGLIPSAAKALARQSLERLVYQMEHALAYSASPIEEAMLQALILAGREMVGDVGWKVLDRYYGDREFESDPRFLRIEPQYQIGSYRVDFLVSLDFYVHDPAAQHSARKETASVIVECDGHDYHDRTKEQASRDRKRDRALQALGFRVFRYTGSDIWKDVLACAEESIRTLTEAARERGAY